MDVVGQRKGPSYLWSNGATGSSIDVGEAGQYSVQVEDANVATLWRRPRSVDVVIFELLSAPSP